MILKYLRGIKMVVKLFCSKQNNFFRLISNGIFKRSLCNAVPEQSYKYLLVLDFEATCDRKKKVLQEIIEFPCIKFNTETLLEEARFHHYVRPLHSPILTEFCIELTGILQEMVDESKPFSEINTLFEEWRQKEGLTDENSLYVTSGDWDLGYMMRVQCQLSSLQRPSHMYQWADIKKVFANHVEVFHNSFTPILLHYGLKFEGRPHSGIDDTLNMVRVIREMIRSGVVFKPTTRIDDETSKVVPCASNLQPLKFKGAAQGPSV